jgi:hypothetical protein
MTKRVLLVIGLIGLYVISMTALAAAADMTWAGWISDSKCGAKGGNASHAACAKKCVDAGAKPVLVTDKDAKVVPIDNPDAVMDHLGHHVQLAGTMSSDGGIHVDKVTMVAPSAMGNMH